MKAKNETYVGPTTFRRFMETFKYLYNLKSQERTETVDQLKSVVSLEFKFFNTNYQSILSEFFLEIKKIFKLFKMQFSVSLRKNKK